MLLWAWPVVSVLSLVRLNMSMDILTFPTCPGILTVHAQGQPGEGPGGVMGQAVQHLQAEAEDGGESPDH